MGFIIHSDTLGYDALFVVILGSLSYSALGNCCVVHFFILFYFLTCGSLFELGV
jgi:hypothetical protein